MSRAPADPRTLAARLGAAPWPVLPAAVFAAAAYLCLVNLDYAALWHDEAPTALIAKNLLERGDIVGWDGRNLVGGTNGRTLNEDLRDVLPPLMYVLNAGGLAVFGANEVGARIVPALVGVASLGLLYGLLRQHLASHPRLLFFAFVFAAWSPQLLLFLRQSRYYAFMVFAVIAGFYLYERYWRTRSAWCLAALTAIAALSFFNHYAGGAATMLSLASWHLMFRARETSRRQWLAFAGCGALVTACGTAYLAWLGVIGGERSGFLAFTGVLVPGEYEGAVPVVVARLGIYLRELFTADWISWPVFAWFAGMLAVPLLRRRRSAEKAPESRPAAAPKRGGRRRRSRRATLPPREAPPAPADVLPIAPVARVVSMGVLFALFSALLSAQPVWANPVADLRYYVGALPLLLAMKGGFVEWVWRRSWLAGGCALAVLLFSSAGAAPFNLSMAFSGERTLGPHLFQFVREIHRPYRDSIRVVSDFLLEHAERDARVYVPNFADREALTFSTGDHVRFCCVLDDDTPLPPERVEALDPRLRVRGGRPDWIVHFWPMSMTYREKIMANYEVVAQLDVYPYPTQRPEINMHAFIPLRMQAGVTILRRRDAR